MTRSAQSLLPVQLPLGLEYLFGGKTIDGCPKLPQCHQQKAVKQQKFVGIILTNLEAECTFFNGCEHCVGPSLSCMVKANTRNNGNKYTLMPKTRKSCPICKTKQQNNDFVFVKKFSLKFQTLSTSTHTFHENVLVH